MQPEDDEETFEVSARETVLLESIAQGQRESGEDELRPHYDFDYPKARPNRFADSAIAAAPKSGGKKRSD